jgi:hypothetical protein
MADAQDLKSWDHKKSCRFESDHRHHCKCFISKALQWNLAKLSVVWNILKYTGCILGKVSIYPLTRLSILGISFSGIMFFDRNKGMKQGKHHLIKMTGEILSPAPAATPPLIREQSPSAFILKPRQTSPQSRPPSGICILTNSLATGMESP